MDRRKLLLIPAGAALGAGLLFGIWVEGQRVAPLASDLPQRADLSRQISFLGDRPVPPDLQERARKLGVTDADLREALRRLGAGGGKPPAPDRPELWAAALLRSHTERADAERRLQFYRDARPPVLAAACGIALLLLAFALQKPKRAGGLDLSSRNGVPEQAQN
jgi:hypothetical protein